VKLTKKITAKKFDNGYWYAHELKSFAKEIGVQHTSKLRKDELEKIIKEFIRTGKVRASKWQNPPPIGTKDYELGLTVDRPVRNFTDNKDLETVSK
jgi:hypothetical protein